MMESAEEFVRRLGLDECPAKTLAVEMVEADRAAVALAAKRELLKEIWALAKGPSHEYGDAVHAAVSELASKYAAKAGGGATSSRSEPR